MKPKRREQIDGSHALLKANLYPENHVYRSKINDAFLTTEIPSDSAIDCIQDMFSESDHSMPFSILAIYENQFGIQENLENDWLAKEVAQMAKHLMNYPKLAYVNYPSYDGAYRQAIINFDDILQVDEYRNFWWNFSVASNGTGNDFTQLKLQLKQELKLELKEQLQQEVKRELKQELQQDLGNTVRNMVSQQVKNASDELIATFEGAKKKLRNDLRSVMIAEIRRELDD